MQFERERFERTFQLRFNRACIRTDILYSACLAVFGLTALCRLHSVPGAATAMLATASLLAYLPLLLLLITLWPHLYIQHREPLAAALKVWAAFVATLLPFSAAQLAGSADGGGSGSSSGGGRELATPLEALIHTGAGFATQLAVHAIGLQTTGPWLVFSQGFVVAASARSAARVCDAYLTGVLHALLAERRSLPAFLASAGLDALCRAYALGMQVLAGFCLTTGVALVWEWRQRREFAAKYKLEPPGGWSLLATAGMFAGMLLLLVRVAAAAVLAPAGAAWAGAAGSGGAQGTCAAEL